MTSFDLAALHFGMATLRFTSASIGDIAVLKCLSLFIGTMWIIAGIWTLVSLVIMKDWIVAACFGTVATVGGTAIIWSTLTSPKKEHGSDEA